MKGIKSMKKFTSILLTLAMVMALLPAGVFAADNTQFSDVTGTEYFSGAASALEELGILTGYPDGTFGAEKSITRAEMAAVVCRMIDKEADAKKAEGKTAFDDVAASHWASGYINIATEEEIINGDGNGRFRPEDDVKYEEAIKMVVCALGLGDNIKVDPKDWSAAYIKAADDKGITTNLKGTKGRAATRGDIALMSYNGLKSELSAPKASLESGTYTGTKSVTLTTATKDADIYYTTDGTTPTVKSTKYTKAISISKTTTLKAIAVKDDVIVSDVMSVDYTVKSSSGGGGGGGSSSSTTKYTVSFDLNYEGATGAPASQSVKKGEKATIPEDPEREGYIFAGWSTSKDNNDLFDFIGTEIMANYTLYAYWIDISDTTDTDADGVIDSLEDYYGTDKTNSDTDDDGLGDGYELFSSLTDPTNQDSDDNGVSDADEDFDADNLVNIQEQANNSEPYLADTDMDGLNDYDEVNTHNTKPDIDDTDEDGLSDGDEIALGLDPLNKMSDGVTLDSLRTKHQTVSSESIDDEIISDNILPPTISGDVTGFIDSKVKVKNPDGDTCEHSSIVGKPIEIILKDDEDLQLSFNTEEYTRENGISKTKELMICRFEDNSWIPAETEFDETSNKISAEIKESGVYFVINADEFLLSLGIDVSENIEVASLTALYENSEMISLMSAENQANQTGSGQSMKSDDVNDDTISLFTDDTPDPHEDDPIYGDLGDADVMFVVDTTGSMSGAISSIISNINSFVTKLTNEYGTIARFGLVTYKDIEEDGYGTTNLHGWTNNVNTFKSRISSISVDGGGDAPESAIDALECARRAGFRDNVVKFMILVTDASYKTGNRYGIDSMNTMASLLANDNIITCVAADDFSYNVLCSSTGGISAGLYSGFDNILPIIGEKIGDIINSGYWARLSTYENTKLEKETDDTDGDGISDIDELGELVEEDLSKYINKILESKGLPESLYTGKKTIAVYKYNSHPLKVDSDGDGYPDGIEGEAVKHFEDTMKIKCKKDERPLKWDVSDRDLLLLSDVVYKDVPVGTDLSSIYKELKGWKVIAVSHSMFGKEYASLAGLQAAAYQRDDNVVIAYRGSEKLITKWLTEPGNDGWKELIKAENYVKFFTDWIIGDITTGIIGANSQTIPAKNFMKDVLNQIDDKINNVYICGHSLGGYSVYMGASEGLRHEKAGKIKKIATFNGFGLAKGGFLTKYGEFKAIIDVLPFINTDSDILKSNANKITDFRILGDPVSTLTFMKLTRHFSSVGFIEKDYIPATGSEHALHSFAYDKDFQLYGRAMWLNGY